MKAQMRQLSFISVFVLAVALTGCTQAQLGAAGCTGSTENFHRSSGTSTVMHGKIRFVCTGVSLTSHSLSSQVQKYVNGAWVNVGSTKYEPRFALSAGVTSTFYTASLPCALGTYRYWAQATGTGNGYTQSTGKYYSNTSVNPCG